MSAPTIASENQWNPSRITPEALIVVAPALALMLHLSLVLTRTINWDEFHFLKQVYDFSRGELTSPLQTFHVRLFSWLTSSDLAAVDQIIRARLWMFAFMVGTSISIAVIAERFTSRQGAVLCALAYLTFGFVLQHGASFRTDPIVTFAGMSALAILARSQLGTTSVLICGAALGFGAMVSIKIVLYAPAFAAIAWLRWADAGFGSARALRLALVAVSAASFAAVFYALHASTLPGSATGAATISNSGATMFRFSPQIRYIILGLLLSAPFYLVLMRAIVALRRGESHQGHDRIAVIGLMSPLLFLFVYTNGFPYFYAFILAPVCVAIAAACPFLQAKRLLVPAAVLMVANAVVVWGKDGPSYVDQQRNIETAVNEMFDGPVAYFDFPGFLPRHKKANFFMTGWGIRNYIQSGKAVFSEKMAQRPVPLLLAVDPAFNPFLLSVMQGNPRSGAFHPDDVEALQTTYRHVWGPIFLSGIAMASGQTHNWKVRVPGPYTVEGQIWIDGRKQVAGEIVELQRETVSLRTYEQAGGLIWGERLSLPQGPAPERPYWTDF